VQAGERQVAPTLAGIRRDHVARYEWAALKLKQPGKVIDVACGVGYGTFVLASCGYWVRGLDLDREALEYARKHYAHHRAEYRQFNAAKPVKLDTADAAVCFETIEHLEDPRPLLKALRQAAPVLLASVPNELVFPHRGRVKFHHRHYTPGQFEALLRECGWAVTSWWGQEGPESEVEADRMGRTLIAMAERLVGQVQPKAPPARPARAVASLKVAAPATVPEHVTIVGLGPSRRMFFDLICELGGKSAYCDEVWGLNAVGDVLRCDRIFHMDDVRIQELRAAARPDSNIAGLVKWLKRHPGPVYTSVVRDGYPGLVAYPLQDVLNGRLDSNGGAPYFNSTAAYAIAYAVHIGVKRLSLFGLDYTLPNAHRAEKGRACCEFWLGIAAARGIEISVPEQTSLLDACEPEELRLYGYDCVDVALHDTPEGGVEVSFKDKDRIPTAAEIEARYDHARHPNSLVEAERKGTKA